MRLEIINPSDWPRWNDLVLATTGYSVFHSANWARVLSTSYGYTPAYFTLSGEGKLLALIPVMDVRSTLTGRRGVSLAFSDYCEPIVDNPECFSFLLDQVVTHGCKSGWEHIEFRGGQSYLPDAPVFANYLGHTLALSENGHDLFVRFKDTTRRNIRKAALAGVETTICTTLQSVREFYRLHCMTRKRHGLPPQPFCFFRNIYEYIISRNCGLVVLATHNNKTIAGAVYFHFGNKALYKFGASDETYQHLRANNLVMWEAIQWYCRQGYHRFDFGRTECENTGLLQFKRGWGASEYTISYYKYDVKQASFVADSSMTNRLHNTMFSMMPIPLLKLAGSMLYRHAG
jgi:hypothetical protein